MTATDLIAFFVSIVAQVGGACLRCARHLCEPAAAPALMTGCSGDEIDRAASNSASARLLRVLLTAVPLPLSP